MKKYNIIIILVFVCMNSCKDLDILNPNGVPESVYYKNETELTTAVNGAYAILQGVQLVDREYFFLHDLRSDEMSRGTGGGLEIPRGEVLDGTLNATNYVMNQVWSGCYQLIHRVNAIIEKGAEVEHSDIRDMRLGEARFLRAFAYFELVSMWGEVPLYTEVNRFLDDTQPRTSEDEIYAAIIADLNQAQMDLPYIKDIGDSDLGRASKEAAQTLLGRVYMFMNDYAKAKTELDKVISSPSNLRLVDDFFSNFTEEGEFNDESIFEVGFSEIGDNNWDNNGANGLGNERSVHSQEYSAVGWRNIIPSEKLLDEYERSSKGDTKEDPRLHMSFLFVGDPINNGTETLKDSDVSGLTSTFDGEEIKISWRKYSILYKEGPNGYRNTGINMRLMRFAEVVLMLAECENELDNPIEAINYLNMIRERPGVNMPPYPTVNYPVGNKTEILRAIQHEKMVELSGEQIRNRDILRWRKQGKLPSEPISYFQARHALLPIPQTEIDNSDKLTNADQNSGY